MKNKIEIKKFSPESLTQVKINEDYDRIEILSRTIYIQDKIPELDTICFIFYLDPHDGEYGLNLGVKTNYGDNAYMDISNLIVTLNLSSDDIEVAKTKLDDYYDSSYEDLEPLIQKTIKKLESKELYLAKQHDKKAKELVLNILNANTTIENIPNEFKPSVKHYLDIRVNQLALSNIFGYYEYVDLPTEVKQVVSITENEYRKLYNLSYEMFATDLAKIVVNELAELPITGFNIMLSNSCFINEVITAPGTNYSKKTFLNPESRPIEPDPFFYVSLKLSENRLSEKCSADIFFYFGQDQRENLNIPIIVVLGPSFSMPNFMPSFNFANLIERKIEINDYYTNNRVDLQMHYFKNETDYKYAINVFKDELFLYLSKYKESILSFNSYVKSFTPYHFMFNHDSSPIKENDCGITEEDLLSKEPDYEKVDLILNRMIELDCNYVERKAYKLSKVLQKRYDELIHSRCTNNLDSYQDLITQLAIKLANSFSKIHEVSKNSMHLEVVLPYLPYNLRSLNLLGDIDPIKFADDNRMINYFEEPHVSFAIALTIGKRSIVITNISDITEEINELLPNLYSNHIEYILAEFDLREVSSEESITIHDFCTNDVINTRGINITEYINYEQIRKNLHKQLLKPLTKISKLFKQMEIENE